MTHLLLLIQFLLFPSLLFGHGFAKNTLILSNNQTFKHINHIKNKAKIYSYNKQRDQHANITIKDRGYSTTNCYINIIINNNVLISCTPTQEFYHAQRKRWVPAYKLTVGDQLLCAHHTTQPVTAIYPVNKSMKVYTVEVHNYHTFFVSPYCVLTHNMSLPCFADAGMGISALGSAGAVGNLFEPVTVLAVMAIAAAAYGIAKIIKSIKGTKYHLPQIDSDTLHHLKQKQQRLKKSKNQKTEPSNNNDKDPKKPSRIENMEKFFLTEFGKKIYLYVERTKKVFQGQTVYRVIKNIPGTLLKKGYQFYLDNFHKDHLEVFDKQGFAKTVIDLNGNVIFKYLGKISGRVLS